MGPPALLWVLAAVLGCSNAMHRTGPVSPAEPEFGQGGCCSVTPSEGTPPNLEDELAGTVPGGIPIPDVLVLDQNGEERRFRSDLVAGKTVVIGFFFTTCTTICPPLTATMAQVQDRLREQGRDDIALISISIDPTTDVPHRLHDWARKFGADPGWTFVTGDKSRIDRLLRAMNVYVARAEDHAPILLVGNDRAGAWRREYALAPAPELVRQILRVDDLAPREHAAAPSELAQASPEEDPDRGGRGDDGARERFTDEELIDQHGTPQRLYTDLIRGRTVVVSSFFSTCTGICPVMHRNLLEIQDAFRNEMGNELFFISITVDPEVDTPERLAGFARGLGAGPGWSFLTGPRERVLPVLKRIGLHTDLEETHQGIFLVGNDRTGVWEKVLGLGHAGDLILLVDRVLHDLGEDPSIPVTGRDRLGTDR